MKFRLLVLAVILAAGASTGCAVRMGGVTAFIAAPLNSIYVTNGSKCLIQLVRNGEDHSVVGIGQTSTVGFTGLSNLILTAKAYSLDASGNKVLLGTETQNFYPSQNAFQKFEWTIYTINGRCSIQQ